MFPESNAGSGGDSRTNSDQVHSTGGAISESDTVITTAANFERLWEEARITVDEAESVRNLAKILSSERGREFILNLDRAGAELCTEILDKVRTGPPSTIHGCPLTNGIIQGLAKHALRAAEKQIFLDTLTKLAGKHSRPPSSIVITMETDFNRLWEEARSVEDESESIQSLAKILLSKEGREFILTLEPNDAELCIEILDYVRSIPLCHS